MTDPRPAILFRQATAADRGALAALEAAAFDDPWTVEAIAGFWREAGARGWLAESADGEIVGFALFREVPQAHEAELLRVATHPAWLRRLVAKRLLTAALAELDRSGVDCFLEVRADNLAAQKLYASLDFEPAGLRPGYYQDGCDARLHVRRAPR